MKSKKRKNIKPETEGEVAQEAGETASEHSYPLPERDFSIRVNGEEYRIKPRAMRNYLEEYDTRDYPLEDCLVHIAMELYNALESKPKTELKKKRVYRVYSSGSIIFRLNGRDIVSMRISLGDAGISNRIAKSDRKIQ